jgi:hypothetical protein
VTGARRTLIRVTSPTPRLRVESACELLGRDVVIDRCVEVLGGGKVDSEFLVVLGGVPARQLLAAGVPEDQAYWLRVWALRGLLWATPTNHLDALRDALVDDHWRVREMACKVVARHAVDDLVMELEVLLSDKVKRVREAAHRALRRIVVASQRS